MNLDTLKSVRQLAQSRPSGTSAVSVFSSGVNSKATITSIVVANTTAGAVDYSLYLDKDGTTYDQTTALFYTISLAARASIVLEFILGLPLDVGTAGNFAVQTSSANALTFTINGVVF